MKDTIDKNKRIKSLKLAYDRLGASYGRLLEYKQNNTADLPDDLKNLTDPAVIRPLCGKAATNLIIRAIFLRLAQDKGYIAITDPAAGADVLAGKSLTGLVEAVLGKTAAQAVRSAGLSEDCRYILLEPAAGEPAAGDSGGQAGAGTAAAQDWKQAVTALQAGLMANEPEFGRFAHEDLMGDIYEQFADRAVRKAVGQFYTPDYVIDYIIDHTVGEIRLIDRPWARVLDPACGSGRFLLKAYDRLLTMFGGCLAELRRRYAGCRYAVSRPDGRESIAGTEYWREENLPYHLLNHCICGADIDPEAALITAVSLLLKHGPGYAGTLNIAECDSLVYWEQDYDWQEIRKMAAGQDAGAGEALPAGHYDNIPASLSRREAEKLARLGRFWSQPFTAVIGNPPYLPVTHLTRERKTYFKKRYRLSEGRINTFSLFLERILTALRPARLGFVLPSRILLNTQYSAIRKYLLTETAVKKVLDLHEGIFAGASVDTVVMILETPATDPADTAIEYFSQGQLCRKVVRQQEFLTFDNCYINIYIQADELPVIGKIRSRSARLGEIADIRDGIIQGAVGKELFLGAGKVADERCKPVLYGENIRNYSITPSNEYIWYDKEWLTRLEDERTRGRGRGLRLREPAVFERVKILTRQTADRIIAALDEEHCYYMNTLHGTHITDCGFDTYYVLGVLNSAITNFYYTRYNYEVGKSFAQVKIENLKNLPVAGLSRQEQGRLAQLAAENTMLQAEIGQMRPDLAGLSRAEIMAQYIALADREAELNCRYYRNLRRIDSSLGQFIGLTREESAAVEQKPPDPAERKPAAEVLPPAVFMAEHGVRGKDLQRIAAEYGCDYHTVAGLRRQYARQLSRDQRWRLYNLAGLYLAVARYLLERASWLTGPAHRPLEGQQIPAALVKECANYADLLAVLRTGPNGKLRRAAIAQAVREIRPLNPGNAAILRELALFLANEKQ